MEEVNPIALLVQYNESVLEEAKETRPSIAALRERKELSGEIEDFGWDYSDE